jgi:hypothetical protein
VFGSANGRDPGFERAHRHSHERLLAFLLTASRKGGEPGAGNPLPGLRGIGMIDED